MNNVKIDITGKVVRRWKENTKSGKEIVYIAVRPDPRQVGDREFVDTYPIKAKDIETFKPFAVGSEVRVEAFVSSREWTSPEGKKIYIKEFNFSKITAVEAEKPEDENIDSASSAIEEDIPF